MTLRLYRAWLSILFLCVLGRPCRADYASINTGIMPFVEEKGGSRPQEVFVSELTNELLNYKFIRLIDRSQRDALIHEIKLGMSGLVDEDTAAKAGKIHGLEVMIFGTFSDHGITARAVHVETHKVIASGEISNASDVGRLGRALASGIETFMARENLKTIHNETPAIQLDLRVQKKGAPPASRTPHLSVGDSVVFTVRSNQDGYLTLVDVQPGGDIVILYPNEMSPNNKIAAGVQCTIPSKDDTFEITVSPPAGTDTVTAFFTEKKADWLDRSKLEGSGFWTVKENEKVGMSRGLKLTATQLKDSEWASKTLILEVDDTSPR